MRWRGVGPEGALLSAPGQTKASLVRAAYIDAEALVKRCLHHSHCFWNEQQVRCLLCPAGKPL